MEKMFFYDTPLGRLALAEEDGALTRLTFQTEMQEGVVLEETPLLKKAARELEEYFAGMRKGFDLPLAPKGTPFQKKVWEALMKIPYGKTASYGEIAKAVGNPKGARAVGMANNRNEISIIIPCHRVIGGDGNLVGYGGGLDKKIFLLELEKRIITAGGMKDKDYICTQ